MIYATCSKCGLPMVNNHGRPHKPNYPECRNAELANLRRIRDAAETVAYVLEGIYDHSDPISPYMRRIGLQTMASLISMLRSDLPDQTPQACTEAAG